MSVDTEKQVSVIEKSIEVFRSGPEILKANQEKTEKALVVGRNVIAQWEAAWAVKDPEERLRALAAVDERSNKYLVNCSAAYTAEKEARAAITQLMDEYKKMFTAAENELDKSKGHTLPARVQGQRNLYVTELAQIEKKKEEERQLKAAKVQARIDYKASVQFQISRQLNNYLAEKKVKLTNSFNAITLDNLDEKSTSLANMPCGFPRERLGSIVSLDEPIATKLLSLEETKELQLEAGMEFDHEAFYTTYEADITEIKRSLMDRLPSKKNELEENKRLEEEAAAREREMEEAKGKKLAALKAQQQIDEQKRLEREREMKARQEAEDARLKEEAEEKQAAAQLEIQMKSEGEKTLNLFDSVAEAASSESKTQTKTGVEIKVLHPAAYVQIFQLFFEKEGKNLGIADLGKKSLDQMKTFCEKIAMKDNIKITGTNLLEYVDTFKAVNKRA